MKWVYFEKRSTTVRMTLFPWTLASASTKSSVISVQMDEGTSSGWNKPAGCRCSVLLRWHVAQALTKCDLKKKSFDEVPHYSTILVNHKVTAEGVQCFLYSLVTVCMCKFKYWLKKSWWSKDKDTLPVKKEPPLYCPVCSMDCGDVVTQLL